MVGVIVFGLRKTRFAKRERLQRRAIRRGSQAGWLPLGQSSRTPSIHAGHGLRYNYGVWGIPRVLVFYAA